MNVDDRMNDDSLDEIISCALSDAPPVDGPLRLARIEKKWRDGMQQYLRRRRWARTLSLAIVAALILVGLVGIHRVRRGDRKIDTATSTDVKQLSIIPSENPGLAFEPPSPTKQNAAEGATINDGIVNLIEHRDERAVSREPTSYERVLFMARTQQRPVQKQVSLLDSIDEVLSGPNSADRLARFERSEVEEELRKRFVHASPVKQRQMLPLLVEFGGDPTITTLIHTIVDVPHEQPETQREFLLAMEQIGGVRKWPELSASIDNSGIRLMISQRLVQLLNHDHSAMRQAATEAIGRSFDCSAVDALIDRVIRQPSGNRDSWFALFACGCPSVNAFLSGASQNPRMIGQYNHARLQWSRMTSN